MYVLGASELSFAIAGLSDVMPLRHQVHVWRDGHVIFDGRMESPAHEDMLKKIDAIYQHNHM